MRAFFLFLLCGLGSLHAAAPVVSNISAVQRANSRLVDITYDVAADFPTVSVSLQVSSDGGSTFTVPATTLSGAIGAGVTTGTAKKITWDAGKDWSGQYSTQMRFKVIADDGAPTISDIAGQTIAAGSNTGAIAFTIGDAQTAAFSLTLSGSSSNTTLVPNANIVFGGSGANRTVLVTPVSGQTGTVTITVTVSDGSLSNSDTFVLTVESAPGITEQQSLSTIGAGSTASLTIVAYGSTPLSYQWYQGAVGVTTRPVGINSPTFTTPALTETVTYWVRISNALGSVDSALSTILVRPSILVQPSSSTINAGNTASLTIVANGSTPLSYQWYQGSVGVTTTPVGTNSSSFTTPALTDSATYWVRVSNAVGFADSTPSTISVRPFITTQPNSQVIDAEATATLTVTASGPAPLSYQWYQGEVGVTTTPVGINSSIFTTPALTDSASYWVRVSNSAGSVDSALSTISLRPSITTQPGSPTINSGATTTLTVVASGPTPISYQWYRGAAGVTTTPVGTNSSSFTTPVLTDSATYWVRVSNAVGTVDSTLSTISVRPIITTQPNSQVIDAEATAALTVIASGPSPLNYQWYQGAAGVTTTPVGTNSSSFTTPVLTSNTTYWVRVSNSAGSVDSASSTISVRPSITTQPGSPTINSGATTTLTVVVSGPTPITYQWYRGAVGVTTTPVGTNSSSFTTPALTDSATYWVRVSNAAGSVNSTLSTISVRPSITTQPGSPTINSGSTTTLTVVANGSTPLSYQWYQGAVGVTTTPVGVNSSSFTTPALTDSATYWVRVSNAVGTVDSTLSTISVRPIITTQPNSQVIDAGATAALTVIASGPPPLSYQWYQGAVGVTTTPVGTNSSSFTTPALTSNTTYWVRVSNSAGSVDSASSTISVRPSITTQPGSPTINSGATTTLTVVASGPTPITYQWYRGAVGVTTTSVGTNSSSFTTPALTDSATYWVRVSNAAGSVNSTLSTISVRPSITTQPGSPTINSGSTTTLTVVANGSTPLSYQWYQGAVGVTTIPVGTNSSSFTTPTLTDSATYWVRVSNAAGTVDSTLSTISVRPIITTQPNSQVIDAGATAALTVIASGPSPLSYQWYQGAAGVTTTPVGTNSSSFTTPVLTSNTTYWVRVSNSAGSVDSASSTISVRPSITAQPGSPTINSGATTTLTVVASGPAPITYQWYRGAVGVTTNSVGTNSSSFTTPALTDSATYWVRVSNAAGSVNSTLSTISVRPSITTQPGSPTINSGSATTLTVVANGSTPLSFQWYQGELGVTTIPVGLNSSSFTTPTITDKVTYWVRVSNAVGTVDSTLSTISVLPGITTQPASPTIDSGSTATLSVAASGPAPIWYQWYQGAVGVTSNPVGSNSPNFTTPALTNTATYWVRVFNQVGSVDSVLSTISVRPKITTQPISPNISAGDTASLSVAGNGSTPLSYQWYQGTVGDTSIPVGTNATNFTTPVLTDTATYWVRVSNAVGSVDSSLSSIAVRPSIVTQPSSLTIESDATATFTVSAIGPGPFSYQWYRFVDSSVSSPVGVDSPSFTTPALSSTAIYWVRVSNAAGTVDSTLATVDFSSLIPPSSFMMGRTSGDTDADAPPVAVNMSTFYYIGKYEVTKALWDEVRTWGLSNGYADLYEGGGKAPNHPVLGINWYDAVKWCNARSQKEGLTPCYMVSGVVMKTGTTTPIVNWNANGYRLPTEAEWEKAARGGVSGKRFPWGTDTISFSDANYYAGFRDYQSYNLSFGSSNNHPTYSSGSMPYTSPVGAFAANGFGLHDMAGNAYEWCWDWYGYATYSNGTTNPTGAASGSMRVLRGGGWEGVSGNSRAYECRASHRNRAAPEGGAGFRVARSSAP